jgi:cell wall-associated NlpC family hydrolase
MSSNPNTRNQAFGQLAKYGLPTSMLQQLKNSQAVQTGRDTETSQGFNQGLSGASAALNTFNQALNNVIQGPLAHMMGMAAGAGGVTGGSAAGGLLGKGLDLLGGAGLMKLGGSALSKILGKGAGSAGGDGIGSVFSKIGSGIKDFFSSGDGGDAGGAGMGEMLSGIPGGAITAGGGTVGPSSSTTSQSSSANSSVGGATSGQILTAVKDALAQVGKPYVWGGDSPATSFDCSGLVEWAYGQAGVNLPRTSQQQWASLKNKSVPLGQVREGDIVFTAGSDGTATSPGHEALMISNKQIVEAPYTGADIRVRAYSPGEWEHAARPVGGTAGVNNGSGTPANNGSGSGNTGSVKGSGNSMGLSPGAYGSSEEVQNVASALLGGLGGGGAPLGGSPGNTNGNSSSGSAGGTVKAGPINSTKGFAVALLNALGAPATQANVNSITHWEALEGGNWNNSAKFNPLNTTYPEPGSTSMNSVGVQAYTSWTEGLKATVSTLENGRYGSIISALKNGKGLTGNIAALGTWSGGAYTSVATGGTNLPPGTTLVGERGPELLTMRGGENVTSAKKTSDLLTGTAAMAAQAPWRTGPLASLWMSDSAQNQNSTGGGKSNITFNFPANAVVVNVASMNSSADISNAASQLANGLTAAMAQSSLVQNIACGNKG